MPSSIDSPDVREHLRRYWAFYEPRRAEIDAAVREAAQNIPAFAAILASASSGDRAAQRERDDRLTRDALLEGRWEPYLQNLREQGMSYARAGIKLSSWLPLLTAFRDVIRSRVITELKDRPEEAWEILAGLNHYVDVVLMYLGEAYVEERGRALQASEERYRLLFEASPLPMWVFDLETHAFLAVNDSAVRQYGYSKEEFLRMSVRDIRPEQDRDRFLDDVANPPQRAEPALWTHRRKDGTELRVEISAHALEFGGRRARLILAHDVTEREQAVARSLALEKQLHQAQKMEAIGRLAGGVAHDFNNMLSVIVGYSAMLLGDLRPGDPLAEDLGEIKKAGERAAVLTKQLLAFSRQQVLQPKVLDLNTVVAGMESMIRRLIGEDVDLAPSALRARARVRADPGQIEQVLLNLVVNARDAMPEGGKLTLETGDVELDDAYARDHVDVTPGRYVMLAVSDTGTGMDKATQARIFEPFFTTKDPGKGTGLGLATVFGIVKQSGGSVWVYSEPGQGTTFKIYLPAVLDAEDALSRSAVVEPLGGSETVLVVEDEDAVRRITSEVLRRHGYQVLEARNAGEALLLSRARSAPIDLLVTDVVMPNMSGGQLASELVKARPGLRVLYMSGYAPDAIVKHGVLEAEAMFVQKPASPEALLQAVRKALARS